MFLFQFRFVIASLNLTSTKKRSPMVVLSIACPALGMVGEQSPKPNLSLAPDP